SGLQQTGMTVAVAKAHDFRSAYRGLGELVYLLCISPWTIPDFDPLGKDLAALLHMEDRLAAREGLILTESRFIIEARKTTSPTECTLTGPYFSLTTACSRSTPLSGPS